MNTFSFYKEECYRDFGIFIINIFFSEKKNKKKTKSSLEGGMTLAVAGRAGWHSSILVLPDPRVAYSFQSLRCGQTVVLCGLEHVLFDSHAVVVTPCQIILCIWISLID